MHRRSRPVRKEYAERGASLVEYALMLALIAVVVMGAVSFFGSASQGQLDKSKGCISAAYDGVALPANCP